MNGFAEEPADILTSLRTLREADAPTHGGRVLSYVYDPGLAELDELAADAARLMQPVNGLDPTTFGSVAALERDLLGFVRGLLHGDDEVVGTVTTGGATSLTINHASNSHVTCAAIEVTKTLTKNGTMVESELFNDTTHEMGTKAITGSTPGIALAPCWFDPWGLASAPTFTPPSGWTTAAQRNTIGDSKRVFWFGYQLLTGAETTISPVLGLSVGDTAGQVSLLTVYKS